MAIPVVGGRLEAVDAMPRKDFGKAFTARVF